jgi:RNA-directed DNA polymerase
LIRYADDFVALCHSRQEALEVKARLARWLASRGVAFNEDKTRVVTLDEGFDFLGFNVRRYGNVPLIKPSKAAQRRIRERLRTELWSLRGTNAQAVIKRLNPIVRGWAAYYRTQVSSDLFGAYLHKFSWTRILRHRLVRHGASPDHPALVDYWAWRRRKVPLPINKTTQELTDSQDGRCTICGAFLFAVDDRPQNPREWEKWLVTRTAVITTAARGPDPAEQAAPRLIHTECRRGLGPELRDAYEPSGLA